MPELHISPTIAALDAGWDQRLATSIVRIHNVPVVTGDALVAEISDGDVHRTDEIVLALLRAAHAGNPDATTVLLRAMRRCVLAIATRARRTARLPLDESVDLALSAMCQAIAEYRIDTWRSSAIVNLSFQARKHMHLDIETRTGSGSTIATDPDDLEALMDDTNTEDEEHPFRAIMHVLSWAADHEVLTREEIRILANWELGTPAERAALSVELNVSQQTLRKRSYRIKRKIHDAVVDSLAN